MISINDMISNIGNTGVLKPHQYSVNMTLPENVFFGTDLFGKRERAVFQLSPRIERVTLPAIAIETTPSLSSYKGEFAIANRTSANEPISISIILSENAIERKYFETWIQYIQGPRSNYRTHFYSDYIGTMELSILSTTSGDRSIGNFLANALTGAETKKVATYSFTGVYPTSVGDVEFSYGDTDTYSVVTVSFNWDEVTRDDG